MTKKSKKLFCGKSHSELGLLDSEGSIIPEKLDNHIRTCPACKGKIEYVKYLLNIAESNQLGGFSKEN